MVGGSYVSKKIAEDDLYTKKGQKILNKADQVIINGKTYTKKQYLKLLEKSKKEKTKGEGETKEKGKEKTGHRIGENGVPIPGSKTVAKNGYTERVDVENPNPREGNGNMHYHEPNNKKWYYDFYRSIFTNSNGEPAPPRIQKLLKLDWIRKAIEKGKNLLKE